MGNEEHFRKLERMYAGSPFSSFFSPRLSVGHGVTELVIPIDRRFFHSAGAVHGAVYFKAMDDAAFFAVSSLIEDVFVLTTSFTVYFHRPVSAGEIRASGRVVHSSRREFVAEAHLTDSEGRPIGRGGGTFTRSKVSLGPEIGYL